MSGESRMDESNGSADSISDVGDLSRALRYEFKTPGLLLRALTHRSRVNEEGSGSAHHNERLEFLGDAVVDLVVGNQLMECLPEAREGSLSKLRAMIVSESSLASVARRLDLGRFLRLGRGEDQTGGRGKASILADTFEALVGAVFQDGGFDAADGVVRHVLGPLVEAVVSGRIQLDHKTRLQELAQGRLKQVPIYLVVDEQGPDHAKVFHVSVSLSDTEIARASGHSKKEAEQEAAHLALQWLQARLDNGLTDTVSM